MKFTAKLHAGSLISAAYPVLVAPAFEGAALPRELSELDKSWRGALKRALKTGVLTKQGEVFIVPGPLGKGIRSVAFVGMDQRDECTYEVVRRAAGSAANMLRKRDVGRICFLVEPFLPTDGDLTTAGMALVEGARLGSYFFDRFKTEKDIHPLSAVDLHLPPGTKIRAEVAALDRVLTLTTSTILVRDWANTPGNQATPTHLAQLSKDVAKEAGITCRVLEKKDCEKLGMGAFLGVARGSNQPPKFIILDYKPRRFARTVCLVGKAITFDSGGISIKPAADMDEMKADMAGGMAVIATMRAVGLINPPRVRIVGIVPATENMPGGSAQKPGDIIRTQSGKTIEVINTDAEGRLILADGLEYAAGEYRPDLVLDVATLTGACVVALGYSVAGFWTDEEDLAESMIAAADATGEPVWRMPLVKDYKELLKSEAADSKNTGGRWGGAITAALFLKQFIGDCPWLHLDIAGPAWTKEPKPYCPKGATGFGPRLLYNFIEHWLESEG